MMKTTCKHRLAALSASSLLVLAAAPAGAASLDSVSFVSTLNAGATVNTTGADIVDWGYLAEGSAAIDGANSNELFSTLSGANYASGGGGMTLTTTSVSSSTTTGYSDHVFTFTDGNSPASGTNVKASSIFGSWSSGEEGSIIFKFNDLGIGTHTITLYLGHRITNANDTRVFKMNYNLTASDENVVGSITSNDLGSTGTLPRVNSVFTLTVENLVDPGADLTLGWDSVSGGSGSGFFSGYTVESVPEPGSLALFAAGGLCMLRRRRK